MDNKKSLFGHIDSSVNTMIDLQKVLTAIPALAPESGGDGEWRKGEALVEWLKKKGFESIENYPAPDNRVSSGKRPNIVASVAGREKGLSVWLMSHLDIVPPGEQSLWKTDPYTAVVADGKIYGRGVEDNQQGLVSSVCAALAFLETGIRPKHTLKLLFVSDEELGSDYGIRHLLENCSLFGQHDLFIVPDGGAADGSLIEVAEKSLLWLRFHTEGIQCHGSRPDQGKNAFLAGSDLVVRLGSLEKEFPDTDPIFEPSTSTFSPTRKDANVPNINTIPGDDVFYLDCRILPSVNVDDVLSGIRTHADSIEKKYGVKVGIEVIQRVESIPTPVTAPLVKELAKAVKDVYGSMAVPVGIGGGTVAAFLRNAGYDTVVWGTMDETAHMPNEYTIISNIVGDAKVMASLALDL